MAERCLTSSTSSPSNFEAEFIRQSGKSESSIEPSSSTGSLTIYCIETGSVAQSIRRRQSLTNGIFAALTPTVAAATAAATLEGHDDGSENDKNPNLSTELEKSTTISNSDIASFVSEDDDETIADYSLQSQMIITPPNHVRSECPICYEQAILQVSPCCYFLCCNSCWRAHILSTINDGRIKVPCITSNCNQYLTRESIINFVRYDTALHDRFLKLYFNANQNPRAKTCPRCCHLYSLDDNLGKSTIDKKKFLKKLGKKIPKQVQCVECSLVWCFRCSAPWHENLTCKQFVKGDKLLTKWINQKNDEQWNARKCPKCSSLIQRAGGCPHMTCRSCSCEFCYLCGRRYVQIPLIGQHSNKFSMFGCPYNFYPEKPWLRRTIRGMIATGVVVASPVIVAGAITAAVAVLPPLGIYKLVKRVRSRRQIELEGRFAIGEPFLGETEVNDQQFLGRNPFEFEINPDLPAEEIVRVLRQRFGTFSFTYPIIEDVEEQRDQTIENEFPLAIFKEMDVENLFNEIDSDSDDQSIKSPSAFRTCPTTPAFTVRKGCSRSLNNLLDTPQSSIDRQTTNVVTRTKLIKTINDI